MLDNASGDFYQCIFDVGLMDGRRMPARCGGGGSAILACFGDQAAAPRRTKIKRLKL